MVNHIQQSFLSLEIQEIVFNEFATRWECSWLTGDQVGDDEEGEGIVLGVSRYPWEGTDRDYIYEEVRSAFVFYILLKMVLKDDFYKL